MKKFLLFVLIFIPFSSISAYDCEIDLHTGAIARTGNFVFPKGTSIQEFSIEHIMTNTHTSLTPDIFIQNMKDKYGKKWDQAINTGLIKVIGGDAREKISDDAQLSTVLFHFTIDQDSISKKWSERKFEYYPIDYTFANHYFAPTIDTQGKTTLPKIYIFSSSLIPHGPQHYKICTVDQQEIAKLGGFEIQTPWKSYVLVPYNTYYIPYKDGSEENYTYEYNFQEFLYSGHYIDTFVKDGKPVLPIEYQ